MQPPYYPASDRNKQAIGDALAETFANVTDVLEIGSGSGQHAVYLCKRFSHLQWQVSDQPQYLEGLRANVEQSGCKNIRLPLELDVSSYDINGRDSNGGADADNAEYSFAYSANTAHIMSLEEVAATFSVISHCLKSDGCYGLYGPFKENGLHNSDGNAEFDLMLQAEDSKKGIRDIAELEVMAEAHGMVLQNQIAMPSNNRILLWSKS